MSKRVKYIYHHYHDESYDINPFIAGIALLFESIIFIFGGPRPYIYKNRMTPKRVVDLDNSLEESLSENSLIQNTLEKKSSQEIIRDDWAEIAKYFEDSIGIYPGSPTWLKMKKGEINNVQQERKTIRKNRKRRTRNNTR